MDWILKRALLDVDSRCGVDFTADRLREEFRRRALLAGYRWIGRNCKHFVRSRLSALDLGSEGFWVRTLNYGKDLVSALAKDFVPGLRLGQTRWKLKALVIRSRCMVASKLGVQAFDLVVI